MKLKTGAINLSLYDLMLVVSAGEQVETWNLVTNLHHLHRYTSQFECAVRLVDFAESRRQEMQDELLKSTKSGAMGARDRERENAVTTDLKVYCEWITMAARDAAINLVQFEHLKLAIAAAASKGIPTIAARVDQTKFEASDQLFKKHFPEAKLVRNAVAHEAERNSTTKERAKKSLSGVFKKQGIEVSGSGHTISHLTGRTLSMSWNGQMVSITVSEDSLDGLIAVEQLLLEAFNPVLPAALS